MSLFAGAGNRAPKGGQRKRRYLQGRARAGKYDEEGGQAKRCKLQRRAAHPVWGFKTIKDPDGGGAVGGACCMPVRTTLYSRVSPKRMAAEAWHARTENIKSKAVVPFCLTQTEWKFSFDLFGGHFGA